MLQITRFGTWQPLAEHDKKENNWGELTGYLGYKPIFCFNAEDEIRCAIGSAIANASCPERLILFETFDYVAFNYPLFIKREAEKRVNGKTDIPLSKIFEECPNSYKMYIVKEIPEGEDGLLMDLPLEHMINGGITADDKKTELHINRTLSLTQSHAKEVYGNLFANSNISLSDLGPRLQKSILTWELLPLWYSIGIQCCLQPDVNIQISDVSANRVHERLSMLFDQDVKPENITEQVFTDTVLSIRNSMRFYNINYHTGKQTYDLPQRNKPCPCCSGLKYKNCCGASPVAPIPTKPIKKKDMEDKIDG